MSEFDETARNALVPVDPAKTARDAETVRRGFWRKLAANAGRVPFAADLLAAFYAATDPATPARAKAVLLGALAYFVVPADAVPDFIAVLGFTDDAAVLLLALRTVGQNLRPHHHARAQEVLARLAADDAAGEREGGPASGGAGRTA
jgi:uncharacterized membrane protein YkvA (DUF1232 family)